MSVFFIDFEAFWTNENEFIIKELCIMNVNNMFYPLHYVFKPTLHWSELTKKAATTNKYLSKYFHKLNWYEGTSIFCSTCIKNNIYQNFTIENAVFYVRDQKVKLMKELFREFRIIGYSAEKLNTIPRNITCPFRCHGKHCAFKKCLLLCQHYLSCQ